MSSKRLFYNLYMTTGNLIQDPVNLTGITASCAQITNLNSVNTTISSLYISNTADASTTSLASIVLSGGMNINKSLLINGNVNLNGVSSQFSGSFSAANNVISASNISGFALNNSVFGSFTSNVNINLITLNQILNAQYYIEGTQTNSGWIIIVSILGDDTGINFSITSNGQLQYTSSNQIGWLSTTINYQVTAINLSSTQNITPIIPTSPNVIISGSLSINSTNDINTTSSASLIVSGGMSILKSIFVGGNVGVNTTSPIHALDINGGIRALTSTISNLISTNISSVNANITNITASTLNLNTSISTINANITTSTIATLISTNINSSTITLSTGLTTGTILNTGLISSANLTSTTSTFPNTLATNITTGTINVSTGITTAALLNTGLISSANLTSTTSTFPNTLATNITTGTINTVTGITTAALLNTGLISTSNLFSTTATVPNAIFTNISSATLVAGTVNVTTGITTATLLNTGIISTSNLFSTTATVPNAIFTNISSATLVAGTGITSTSAQITNIISTSISVGTLSSTTITGANLSLSGNLIVGGTLTTVNITSTNILNTNISVGTIISTGLSSLQNVTLTNASASTINVSTGITASNALITNENVTTSTIATARVTSNLIAIGNSNTIGSIFTTGGNIGVNTVTPSYKLDINGTGNFSSTLTVGGGISLNNVTSNTISFSANGVAAPANGGGSGAKIVLWPMPSDTPYSIGINSNTLWYGVPSSAIHNWYISGTSYMNLSSTALSVNNIIRSNFNATANGAISIRCSPQTNAGESSIGFYQNTSEGGASWITGHNPGGAGSDKYAIYSSTLSGNALTIQNNGTVGIGTNSPSSKLHVNGNRINLHNAAGTGGGQNLFNGVENAIGRAQIVLSSSYSDLVIASSQANDVHGSTLTFASYNPNNSSDYRKWVINQGNWGSRIHMLEFGYNPNSIPNPHTAVDDTYTTMTLDGTNKRLGINNRSPEYRLDVNGDAIVRGWLRTTGETGFFNNTYNRGIYVKDSTWVRTYPDGSAFACGSLYCADITTNNNAIAMGSGTINFSNNGAGLNWANNVSQIYDDGDLRIKTDDNMRFFSGNVEKMIINSGGLYITGATIATLLIGGVTGNGIIGGDRLNDTFTYNSNAVNHYSLKWNNDSDNAGGPTGYLSSWGGLKFFTYGNLKMYIEGYNGTVRIPGSMSKGSGTFDIEHPLDPNYRLVHSFIEGPRCDLIYRGSVQLVNGTATVNIDSDSVHKPESAMRQGTFQALCANPDIFLQNKNTFDQIIGNISGNILTIISNNTTSNALISWMVIAERKDPFIKKWNRTNADGYLITEYNKSESSI